MSPDSGGSRELEGSADRSGKAGEGGSDDEQTWMCFINPKGQALGKGDPVPHFRRALPGAVGCGEQQCQGQDYGTSPPRFLTMDKLSMKPHDWKKLSPQRHQ